VNEEAVVHWGLSRQKQTNKQKTNKQTVSLHFCFIFVTHPASCSMGIQESFYRVEVVGV
jgi:hypothetical protein